MRSLTEFCAINWSDYWKSYKWPRLSEAAQKLDIKYSPEELHGAESDTELCFAIFRKMSKMDQFRSEINSRLENRS